MADIEKLRPKTKELCKLLISECKKNDIDIIITQTERSMGLQTALYAQGRQSLTSVNEKRKIAKLQPITEKENKSTVTNAMAGKSAHNFGLAFDVGIIVNGKVDWNRIDLFKRVGEIGIKLNIDGYSLTWGGNFSSIKDYPHFEMTDWKKYV